MRERNPSPTRRSSPTCASCARQAIHSASEEAVEKQHAKGKLTARERIEKLVDPGSFEEIDPFVRHRTYDFEIRSAGPGETPWSPVMARSTAARLALLPRLHGLRRLPRRGHGREGVQGDGSRRRTSGRR